MNKGVVDTLAMLAPITADNAFAYMPKIREPASTAEAKCRVCFEEIESKDYNNGICDLCYQHTSSIIEFGRNRGKRNHRTWQWYSEHIVEEAEQLGKRARGEQNLPSSKMQ